MKTTLLLSACLLTALTTMPVAASPATDIALLLTQASINPAYLKLDGIKSSVEQVEIAVKLIEAERKPAEFLEGIALMDRFLILSLNESIEGSETTNLAGEVVIDTQTFASIQCEMLNNKYPENMKYSAIGWGITQKKAKAKLDELAKNPTFEGTQDAIIAILQGLRSAAEAGGASEEILEAQQHAVDAARAWTPTSSRGR